jgi:hypothetical protein
LGFPPSEDYRGTSEASLSGVSALIAAIQKLAFD